MNTFIDFMQDVDCIALMLFCGPFAAVLIYGLLILTKLKSDTMQHNSSKASPYSLLNAQTYKDNTFDFGISRNINHQKSNISSEKQRKSRSTIKRLDTTNNKSILHPKNNERLSSSGFAIKNWLENDVYTYKEKFISSCFEDKTTSYDNISHRNRTSSEAADDLNSSSSNEDLYPTYLAEKKIFNKETKSRQKKQQKCKSANNSKFQNTNVNEVGKENNKNSRTKQIYNADLSLRKQCTKAAALRAALNNSNRLKTCTHSVTASAYNLSKRSLLSPASSTTSINSILLSSASNSPAPSVNSSPTSSPIVSKRNTEYIRRTPKSLISPLRQFTKLSMNEKELIQQLKRYVIDPSLLRVYGFPVESVCLEDHVEIYKCLPKHLAEEAVTKDNQRHHRHFYGRRKGDIINDSDGLYSNIYGQHWYSSGTADSGHGSGESSPRFADSDSSEIGDEDSIEPIMSFFTPDGVYQIFSHYCNSIEKQCVRCSKMFQVNKEGEYLTFDSCTYHWGKISSVYNGKCYVNIYSCCQGEEISEGCCQHSMHVWNGIVVGINGPYTDFLHTQYKETNHQKHPKVYAIDCEMSYTGLGLEVTKVTVVGYNGSLVYEHFVKTQSKIIDYNTRFSGVSEKDLLTDSNNSIKTFSEVQKDLLNLFDANTILIGHALDNDLRVLRLVHKTIVDTSVIFSHSTGYPYRRSLKNLTKSFLKRDIQCGDMGHSSFEDSRACLELIMWKVRKDLRHWNYQ